MSPSLVVLEATGGLEREFAAGLAVVNPRDVRDFARRLWRPGQDLDSSIRSSPVRRTKEKVIRRAPGVGPVLSAAFLANLPELGTVSGGEVSALVGVAPFN